MATYCDMNTATSDSVNKKKTDLEDEYHDVISTYYDVEYENTGEFDNSDCSSVLTDDGIKDDGCQDLDADFELEGLAENPTEDEAVEDIKDDIVIDKFYGVDAVACCSNKCNIQIPKEMAVQNRRTFEKLLKPEQDAVILGCLQAHKRLDELASVYEKNTHRGKSKLRKSDGIMEFRGMRFFFADIPVCRKFFFFLHNVRRRRYENIVRHFITYNVTSHTNGFTNHRSSKNEVMQKQDIERVVTFIRNFAEKYALPLPGRIANFKEYRVVLLPSTYCKSSIHRDYCEASKSEPNAGVADLREFNDIWNKFCRYIMIDKPISDLCGTCRVNVKRIQHTAVSNHEAKLAAITEAQEHLQDAKEQQEFYNAWRQIARHSNYIEIDGVQRSFSVLSFDFAEQVHYPSLSNAVGAAFLKTARKCGVFGVHDERLGVQRHYLIDEADIIGKGSNTVVSLIHHYLSTNSSEVVIIFADNCTMQNINCAMVKYFSWRVFSGLNARISLHNLFTGHTKFSPNRNFGLFKHAYSKMNIDCLEDLICCVMRSSPRGFNTAVATILNGDRNVVWSAWEEYLTSYFRSIPDVNKYRHFTFTSDGKIELKIMQNSDSEFIRLQNCDMSDADTHVIEDIVPEPLTVVRQWYLYEQIRDLCINDYNKNKIAPKPDQPKEIVEHIVVSQNTATNDISDMQLDTINDETASELFPVKHTTIKKKLRHRHLSNSPAAIRKRRSRAQKASIEQLVKRRKKKLNRDF